MLEAIIFDMNGVIVDDERIHQQSWCIYCERHGMHLTEEEFMHKVFGRTEQDTFQILLKRPVVGEELERLSNERVDLAIELFKSKIKLADGLQRLLDEVRSQGVSMGVATSSRRRYYDFIVDTLDIRGYFGAALTAQDIVHGKPDPEIYLRVAELLNVPAGGCVVFEDSLSGVAAAKRANMKVVGITTTHTAQELTDTDKLIDSFAEVNLADLRSLF